MRTVDQIKKKIVKLERRLKLLYKYRHEVNFTNASNVISSSSEYEDYTKDILNTEGKIKMLKWVLDEDTLIYAEVK